MTDLLISVAIAAAGMAAGTSYYVYARAKKEVLVEEEYETMEDVLDAVKLYIVGQVKDEAITSNLSEKEILRLTKRKTQIKSALKNAPNGVREAKLRVKEMIRTWVVANLTKEKIRQLLGLDTDSEPNSNTMFEIILYRYQKEYSTQAFQVWMEKTGFYQPQKAVGMARKGVKAYYVTPLEFENAYYEENFQLTDDEMVDILVIKLYESYMGWGPIDTLAEMDINGYNIGVSGSLMGRAEDNETNRDSVSTATNCFWVYYKSNYIHLQFLEFGSQEEIRRICQLLIRWGNPGPLTSKGGYKVNTMHDKSRILAIRPDAGEAWGVFVRKFSLDIKSPEDLIIKKGVTSGEICAKLIEYLMLGQITIAVTGRQGSGKTTLMKGIMAFLPPDWNIRVLEMAPELYLRETYPNREIFSVQETRTLSMEELQDALKKSDSTVTVIGEVATDAVAARMIQLAMTGSLMTIFSHHANTAKELVLTIRNSLVNAGGFDNMQTAEKQVTDVLKMNIHLGFRDGKRFIERITEIYQSEEGADYPSYMESDPTRSMYELNKEYFYRQTDRISFNSHDILRYNIETDTYEVGEPMSQYLYGRIYEALPSEDKPEFEKFIKYYWENQSLGGYEGISSGDSKNLKDGEPDRQIYTYEDALKFLSNQVQEEYRFD